MIQSALFFGPVAITVVIGVITLGLLYLYSVRNHDYWRKRGIPTAKTAPLFGSIYESFSEGLHEIELKRYRKLGRIYGHFEANNPVLSIGDPALLRDILVKDFNFFHDRRLFNSGDKVLKNMLTAVTGEDWKRIRSIVSPTFSTGKIKRMMSIFKACAKTLCQNFKKASEANQSIDAKRLYGAFTMDIIASSAFSTKIDSHNDPDNTFVQMARRVFSRTFNWRFFMFFLAPRLMKLLRISVFDKTVMDFFIGVTLQIVEERKKTGKSRNDFLQLLMDTAKEVSEEQKWEEKEGQKTEDITSNYGDNIEQQVLKTATSKHLSMDELVAQCVIFFLAGYDTTASTLSFISYNLALYPEIQEKLRNEVDQTIKENNGELNYEAIQNMKYMDNVISETLRLFPPAVRLERLATAEYKLGDTGITIPKGMIVTIPTYAMHKDPDFYPEPEKFDPDRFSPEERGNRDIYTYLPFGAGPRNCVGMRFALMEIKMCLASVIAKFIIKKCPETKVPLEFNIGQGLLQPKEIILKVEIREDSPIRE